MVAALEARGLASEEEWTVAATIYLVVGSFSIVACTVLALVACLVPSARREHASKMVLIIAVSDLAFTFKYWISSATYLSGRRAPMTSFGLLSDHCVTEAAYGFITATSSQLWNACFAVEIMCLLANPLRSTRSNFLYYNLAVWPLLAAMSLYLIASGAHLTANPQLCMYISPAASRGTIAVAELPVYGSTALAAASLVYAAVRLCCGRNAAATRRARLTLFGRHLVFMVIFMSVWAWDAISEFVKPTQFDAIIGGSQGLVLGSLRLLDLWWVGGLHDCWRPRACGGRRSVDNTGPTAAESALPNTKDGELRAPLLLRGDDDAATCEQRGPTASHAAGSNFTAVVSQAPSRWLVASTAGMPSQRPMAGVGLDSLQARNASSTRLCGTAAPTAVSACNGVAAPVMSLNSAPPPLQRQCRAGGGYTAASRPRSVHSLAGAAAPSAFRARAGSVVSGGSASNVGTRSTASSSAAAQWDITRVLRDEVVMCVLSGLCQGLLHSAALRLAQRAKQKASVDRDTGLSTATPVRDGASQTGRPRGDHTLGAVSASFPASSLPPGAVHSLRQLDAEVTTRRWRAPLLERMDSEAFLQYAAVRASSCDFVAATGTASARSTVASGGAGDAFAGSSTDRSGLSNGSAPSGRGRMLSRGPRNSDAADASFPLMPDATSFARRPGGSITVDAFTVTSYGDAAFAQLRESAGIRTAQAVRALDPALLSAGVLSAHCSEGASSSFFCHSADRGLIVKTVSREEVEQLLAALPSYMQHLRDNPASLLCRFYGCYSVSVPALQRVHFLLMGNSLPVAARGGCSVAFDLKGSSLNRSGGVEAASAALTRGAAADVLGSGAETEPVSAQDDAFFRLFPDGVVLDPPAYTGSPEVAASASASAALSRQVAADVRWLESRGLMDYSMLLMLTPLQLQAAPVGGGGEGAIAGGAPVIVSSGLCELTTPELSSAAMVHISTPSDSSHIKPLGECLHSRDFDLRVGPPPQGSLAHVLASPQRAPAGACPSRVASATTMPPDACDTSTVAQWSPLAVHRCHAATASASSIAIAGTSAAASTTGPQYLLQVGLIDLLQAWTLKKRIERGAKQALQVLRTGSCAAGAAADMSALQPHAYADRFLRMVGRVIAREAAVSCIAVDVQQRERSAFELGSD
jgi:hypothetical protein